MAFIALGISCWESPFPEAPTLLLSRQPSHKGTLNSFTAKLSSQKGLQIGGSQKPCFFLGGDMVKDGEAG